MNRRSFLTTSLTATAGIFLVSPAFGNFAPDGLFKFSLAEWSFHKTISAKEMENLQFPVAARQLGFDAVEYVNQFFFDKAKEKKYLAELKKICKNEGVKSLLIMCDNEGKVGHPDKNERAKTVENHKKWIDAAAFLGCHSVRVNAGSQGTFEEQQKYAADGLFQLCEYSDKAGLNVIVENHGGLSSNADWLVGVMKLTNHPKIGTLPDFGNFRISQSEMYDRYKGVELLMPYAKGVSAKSHNFDADGNETEIDFPRMLKIVADSGYRGYIDVEYEGSILPEKEGVIATKKLLEKAHNQLLKG